MTKFYFLSAIALSSVFVSAQVLESDNYNALIVGNVGTDVSGATPGQGGIYTYSGANTDYKIATIDVAHGNSLQITSGAGVAAADNRYAFKVGLADAWNVRTAGNDIIKGTLELYTGTSTGNNRMASVIYGAAAGIVGISYNSQTKVVNGFANLTNNTTLATGFFSITGISALVLPANTWVSVGYTYDSVNGVITYTVNGTTSTLNINGYTVTKNLVPVEHDIASFPLAGNTASTTAAVDNVTISATNSAALGTAVVGQIGKVEISLYPNPTSDYLNFSAKVKSVQIFDAAGRNVSAGKAVNNQVDVRNLAKGVYMVKFETENGTQTQKFIKK